jgi:hypothetical protein
VRSYAKETLFWSAFGLWFVFEPVLVRGQDANARVDQTPDCEASPSHWQLFGTPQGSEDLSLVIVAHRREESYTWLIPDDDDSLLNGVGARGTSSRKSDDTFETLLLMRMQMF